MKYWVIGALAAIVLLGGFLRMFGLSISPPSLNWDEASIGYNALSLLETGKDQDGVVLPLYTRSFDDYKSTIPIFLSSAAIAVVGPTEAAVRLPSALFSTASIILVYLLAVHFFKRQSVGLIAAFLYAVEPWAVYYTRGAYHEAAIAFVFLLLGLWLFLIAQKRLWLLPVAGAVFVLSMLTYYANKVFIPLFILGVLVLYWRQFIRMPRTVLATTIIVMGVFVSPFVIGLFTGSQLARAKTASVFLLWPRVVEWLQKTHPVPSVADFVIHNKLYYFLWEFFGRYLAAFSPAGLFVREGRDIGSAIPDNAVLYPFEFPFWVIGLVTMIKRWADYRLLILIMLLAPLAPSVGVDWFHPARMMALTFVFTLAIAFGVVLTVDWVSRSWRPIRPVLYIGLVSVCLVYTLYLFDSLFTYLPYRDYANWQPGFEETVPKVMERAGHYDHVWVATGQAQPYIFYLYYGHYSPAQYQTDHKIFDKGTQVLQFGKFTFKKWDWEKAKMRPNTLFVGDGYFFPENAELQKDGFVVYDEIKDLRGFVSTKIVGRPQ